MGRNDALRAARLRRGWRTIEAAAAALAEHGQRLLDDRQFTVSARTWRRWEGKRPGWPGEETAIVLHDALGRWPEDLGFTIPPGWIRPEYHEEEQVHRRAFTSVAAAALVVGPVAPQHVDPALVGYFQQQLEGHYRADMFLGPHDLIGTVSAQYQLSTSWFGRPRARRDVDCCARERPMRRSSDGCTRTPAIWTVPRSGGV
ncbi:hypothetical protein [Streptomyces cyaneofuscatus]|uniref:hypothetical protein n=1 Tax=Streptomyces cyaneofuscatus TaxID=66883 RepID=UPI001EF2906E|nr:hypothetical protein [Streptomyces cyaneofuscatus]